MAAVGLRDLLKHFHHQNYDRRDCLENRTSFANLVSMKATINLISRWLELTRQNFYGEAEFERGVAACPH